MAAENRPQFCPWCGSPIGFEAHEHEPRYAGLAKREGIEPQALPERVRDLLAGEAFVGVCPGCRTISHVVGHRPQDA
jgi:hypothetical protein